MTVKIDIEDLGSHVYVCGPTTCGKSTLMAILALQLQREGKAAVIWIDPKGIESKKFLNVLPDLKRLRYLDPSLGFAISPLSLPKRDGKEWSKEERERWVSLYSSQLLNIMNVWFAKDGENFSSYAPRASHLVEMVIRTLYSRSDNPTLADIYHLCSSLRGASKSDLNRIASAIGDPELAHAVADVGRYEPEAWDPLLTRFGAFATDVFLKSIFCSEKPSADIISMLEPGSFTILNCSEQSIGSRPASLIMSAFVLSVWFGALIRAEFNDGKMTPIVVFLDEFHRTAALGIAGPILTLAAAFGLYLVFAHQSISQIDRNLAQQVLTNTGIQICGRLGGADAQTIASFWSPDDKWSTLGKLSRLSKYEFMLRSADTGPEPVTFKSRDWPDPIRTRAQVSEFMQSIKSKPAAPAKPIFDDVLAVATRDWKHLLPIPLFRKTEWQLLNAFAEKSWTEGSLKDAFRIPEDEFKRGFNYLVSQGYVGIKKRTTDSVSYCLLKKGMHIIAEARNYGTLGGPEAAALAKAYIEKKISTGNLISVARQRTGRPTPDLIEFLYETATPVAVEVETHSELIKHPEQVEKNAEKNFASGFSLTIFAVSSSDIDLARKVINERRGVAIVAV